MTAKRRTSRGTPLQRMAEARARRAGEASPQATSSQPETPAEVTPVSDTAPVEPAPTSRVGRTILLVAVLALGAWLVGRSGLVGLAPDLPVPQVSDGIGSLPAPGDPVAPPEPTTRSDLRPIYGAPPLPGTGPDMAPDTQATPPRLGPLPDRSLPLREAPVRSRPPEARRN